MRLARLRTGDGMTHVVAEHRSGATVPLAAVVKSPLTMEDLITADSATMDTLREQVEALADATAWERAINGQFLSPVARPGKVVAIGRNYRDHAMEAGADVPTEPLVFAKFPSSVIGHDEAIRWDGQRTRQVDFEAELGVVIGRTARSIPAAQALDVVFGYTCLNDVSARDLQFLDGQWVRGKSLDTFCPIGPVIVTRDEIPDPQDLRIRCLVDGEVMQEASTSEMLFGVSELIAFCAANFTLHPGDVIATGTPSGVGVFRVPPRFLRDGDEVIVEIERIGRLRNPCRIDMPA